MTGAAHAWESVPGLLEVARRQRGMASRQQLRELGIDDHDVRHQLAARRWSLASPLVVALFTGRIPRDASIWAAALHCRPGALVDAWTALEVYGLRRWERPDSHVLVARGRTVPRASGLVVHESRRLDPEVDRDPRFALPVVRPARAAIDAASWSNRPAHAAGLIAAVVQQRICTPADLRAELANAGLIRFRARILGSIDEVTGGADSLAEMRIGPILAAAGLPAPRRQTPHVLDGVVRRTDIEVELPDGSVLVIEVDGPDHDAVERRADDTLRDLDHLAADRVTIRVAWWALTHRRVQLVARLSAVRRTAEAKARAAKAS